MKGKNRGMGMFSLELGSKLVMHSFCRVSSEGDSHLTNSREKGFRECIVISQDILYYPFDYHYDN